MHTSPRRSALGRGQGFSGLALRKAQGSERGRRTRNIERTNLMQQRKGRLDFGFGSVELSRAPEHLGEHPTASAFINGNAARLSSLDQTGSPPLPSFVESASIGEHPCENKWTYCRGQTHLFVGCRQRLEIAQCLVLRPE